MGGKYLIVSVDDLFLIIYNVNKYDVGLYKFIVINVVGIIISDVIEISIYNNIIYWIIKKNLYKKIRCLMIIMLYYVKYI